MSVFNLPDGVTSDDIDRDVDEDCLHQEVDLDLGFAGDPAREVPDHGTCSSCGAEVHLEHDEDRVYWEID